jgi:hypothetical protein
MSIQEHPDIPEINTERKVIRKGETYAYDKSGRFKLVAPIAFIAVYVREGPNIKAREELFGYFGEEIWKTSQINKHGKRYTQGPLK